MAFSTTSELAVHAERELGHQLSGSSSQRTDIVSHLDRAHKLVLSGGGILNYDVTGRRLRNEVVFPFARAQNPKVLTLLPSVTTATVTATRNSSSITFSADPNAGTSVANYFARLNNEEELYRVLTHTAASTAAVLDAPYVGSANLSAASCEIFKLQYDLGSSDILQLISPIRTFSTESSAEGVKVVDKDVLLRNYPQHNVRAGFPRNAAIIKESAGTVTLQMSSYPSDLERIEADYIPIPSTLDTTSVDPIIPAQYRLVLSHLTVHFMSVRNDDARAEKHLALARDMFAELVDWSERLSNSGDPDFGRIRIAKQFGFQEYAIGIQSAFVRSN